MKEAYIKAIEYYLPQKVVTNEQLSELFPEWDAEKVTKKTGIKERHISKEDETASDMALAAANKLFNINPQLKEQIDFLLFCTQSPDYKLPTSACILQDRLGLPCNIGALDFNLGCSGWIYGLALAKGLIASGMAKNVLLLTAETYCKYIHAKDKGNQSLFGDGAAATVLSTEGIARVKEFVLGTDGRGADNLIVKTGGARYPKPLQEEGQDANGYLLSSEHLYMNGPEIFNFTLDAVPPLLDECLEKNALTKEQVDLFVLHQANQYILNTIRKIYGVPKERFYIDLEHTGNTVSSTIPIALNHAISEQVIAKGQHVIVAGFGVGYSYGACQLDF